MRDGWLTTPPRLPHPASRIPVVFLHHFPPAPPPPGRRRRRPALPRSRKTARRPHPPHRDHGEDRRRARRAGVESRRLADGLLAVPTGGRSPRRRLDRRARVVRARRDLRRDPRVRAARSEEHTSELQSPCNLVCRLLLEKKKHLLTALAFLLPRLFIDSRCSRAPTAMFPIIPTVGRPGVLTSLIPACALRLLPGIGWPLP